MLGDFLRGFSYVPAGFRLLPAPRLRPFVWVPVIINVLVFAGLFWLGAEYFQSLLDSLLPKPSTVETQGWLGDVFTFLLTALRWLLWPLFLLAGVVVMFYTFTAVANLIGSPFNTVLSARVEQRVTGRLPAEVSEGSGILVEVASAISDELRKIGYFALLGVPLLVLFFIPVVNIAAPFLWGVYGAWIIALEYSDYPLGNQGIRFADQRVIVRQRRFLHLGFGAGILALTIIPGLNLVAMPVGVIGATLLRTDLGGGNSRVSGQGL